MNQTLQNISCDAIRQNWNNHTDHGITNSPFYDIVWNDWENKYTEFTKNIFYPILKKFVMGNNIGRIEPYEQQYYVIQENENMLILKGLGNDDRKHVHLLCDKIGLHHKSVQKKKNKHLWIYKPVVWLWEYTEKNPHSKSEEYYKKREFEKQIKKQQLKEKLSRRYCCICEQNGWETELFCSVYIRGLYCNDCLETTSDEGGGNLCDHKFEPYK